MYKRIMKIFVFLSGCLFLSGCSGTSSLSHFNEPEPVVASSEAAETPLLAEKPIHYYVTRLAQQLFDTSSNIDLNKSIAVGTILPVQHTSGKKLPVYGAYGLQIQESLMTLATQAGLQVIDFKAMPMIKVGENYDMMLSRELAELNSVVKADYYLTGTYSEQENSLVVNIRLVDIRSTKILAAATDYIPVNTMWSRSKVSIREQIIYRNEY
jgi:TolB-like protein